MNPFDTYQDLLAAITDKDCSYSVVSRTVGGLPLTVIETGGNRNPPIVITAGCHATEQAGVTAVVELIDRLDTPHSTYIVPTRDPVGLNGYQFALRNALGETDPGSVLDDVPTLLQTKGDVVITEDSLTVSLIGDVAFAWMSTAKTERESSQLAIFKQLKLLQNESPSLFDPLKGRRVYLPAGQQDIEGSGALDRAYSLVISPNGQVLHLNRYFDTPWAPPETRVVRDLLTRVEPGLFFDVHETQLTDDRFHLGIRHQQVLSDQAIQKRIGNAIVETVRGRGVPLATDKDIFSNLAAIVSQDPEQGQSGNVYQRVSDGLYKVDQSQKEEGLNATEFATNLGSLSYVTETGMHDTFENRVETAIAAITTGIDEYEQLHN